MILYEKSKFFKGPGDLACKVSSRIKREQKEVPAAEQSQGSEAVEGLGPYSHLGTQERSKRMRESQSPETKGNQSRLDICPSDISRLLQNGC